MLGDKPATMVLLIFIRTLGDEVLDSTTIVAMPHFRVTTLSWRGLVLGPLELVLVGIPKGIGGESQMFIECILVTSLDVRLQIWRKLMCALHSCIENLGNFRAFK
jgi:hypothetical protein